MSVTFSGHRMDKAHLVSHFGQIRQQIRNHLARLAPRLERPLRRDKTPLLSLKRDELLSTRQRLTVTFNQFRLVIKTVDMT